MDNCCEGKEGAECCKGYCKKCHGMIWGLLGVLILINAFVWPQWAGTDGWMAFFGLLLVFGGVLKSVMPGCGCHHAAECCKTEAKEVVKEVKAPVKEAKKKK